MSRAPHFELKEEKKNVACSRLGWKEAIRSKYSTKTYPLCRLTSRCSRFYLRTSPFLACPPCPPCLPCPPLQQCSSRRVQHATDRFMLQPLRTWEVCLSTVFQEYSNTELIHSPNPCRFSEHKSLSLAQFKTIHLFPSFHL